jgi:hypothetical protein
MYRKTGSGLSIPNFMGGNFTVLPADRVNDILYQAAFAMLKRFSPAGCGWPAHNP